MAVIIAVPLSDCGRLSLMGRGCGKELYLRGQIPRAKETGLDRFSPMQSNATAAECEHSHSHSQLLRRMQLKLQVWVLERWSGL